MSKREASTAVVTRGARRHRTRAERRLIVEESFAPGASLSAVAMAHNVRSSQIYHWRRLYQQGRLDVESAATALVPVRISDAQHHPAAPASPASNRVATIAGTIHLQATRGQLRIEGAVDAGSLRVVLEYLLG
jgi:transposase